MTAYLFGSPGATALTAAMIVFFISGETYHRAGAGRGGEDTRLVRRADFLSGVAALFLAVSLALFGSFWLALTSTVLLAGGKFGNALTARASWPIRLELPGFDGTTRTRALDLFRLAALLSRAPAVIAIVAEILRLGMLPEIPAIALSQSGILLICYCFWISADLALFETGDQKPVRE